MRFCKTVAIVASLVSGPSSAMAATESLGPADRALLSDYARDTWRSIAAIADRGPLPADALRHTDEGWVAEGLTSPSNLAAYLWSTVAAEDLRLISPEESGRRVGKTLSTLAQLERSHGFFFNWYEPSTGKRASVWPGGGDLRPFLSVVDNGWLAAALMLIGNSHPEFREATDAILQPMNFGFFYNPYDASNPIAHPGLLRGGYWADDGTFAAYHYGALNTEPRIASYIGIARGEVPEEHYFRMFRASQVPARDASPVVKTYDGVPVDESTVSYRGMHLVPTWDGTMFEALMVSLLVPEADWAPQSWGANHPLYVRAQIEYGLHDAQLGYWGHSAAMAPGGGYGAYGVPALGVRTHNDRSIPPRLGIIAPYAAFLALPFAPLEAMANLKALANHFPVYGPFGFVDSVDVLSGKVSDSVLILDQGMILGALSNVIGSDVLRRGFCEGAVERSIRPMLAREQFETKYEPSLAFVAGKVRGGRGATESSPEPLPKNPALLDRTRLGRHHLFEGFLTAAGVSAVIACRSRVSKATTPTGVGGRL